MNLDSLFEDFGVEEEYTNEGKKAPVANMIRCKCGSIVNIVKPTKCDGCGEYKCYWQMIDGSIKRLEDMDMGHLTNTVKMLARKLETDGPKLTVMWRESMELAIDLFYREIGSRTKEIEQASGIMSALNRSLEAKKPDADVP